MKAKDQLKNVKKIRDPGKTIEVLFKISDAVTQTRNLDELYRVIHESLDEILNVDNFYIALLDEKKDALFFPYHVDEKDKTPDKISNFSKTTSSTGMVIQQRRPLIFYKKDIIRLLDQLEPESIGTPSKIWLGAPLVINSKVKGAIVIQSYTSQTDYKKDDLDLLNSVSQHIALAIERKEADENFNEQRSILEAILESSPMGIALVQNRVFKWVNNEMVQMFGYQSKADFENKSTRMIYVDGDDYDNTGKTIYKGLTKDGLADYENQLLKKDKSLFSAHIRLNCRDKSDPMEWTIATFTDISIRKAAEKETYEKERLQGVLEMAGAVCHEINQPLQAILGYSELLLMSSKSKEVEKNGISAIKRQAGRLGKITQKLSKITRYRTLDYPGNTKIVDIWGASDDTKY